MNENSEIQTIRSIMREVGIAMMTTVDDQGRLTSRPMATQRTDSDGDAWFIVDRDSDLAGEVAARPRVNIAYSGSSSWLSLSGSVELE